MKKFINIFLFVIVFLGLFSCVNSPEEYYNNDRIVLKEKYNIDALTIYIIEIDGVEYVTQFRGGFCPILKPEQIDSIK